MHSVFVPWNNSDFEVEDVIQMSGYRSRGHFSGYKSKPTHVFNVSPVLVNNIELTTRRAYSLQIAIAARTGKNLKKAKGNYFYISGVMVWFESAADALMFKLSHGG